MARAAIDFSTPIEDLLGGGGSILEPGLYRCERSVFGYYDFGKQGNEALCMIHDLQPVNDKHKDNGEVVTRYFPLGGKNREGVIFIEPCDPVKGTKGSWKSVRFTDNDKHGKIGKNTEFGVFLEYCAKNGVDMDAVSNDITAFAGNVYEYGIAEVKKNAKAKTAVEEAEVGDAKGGKPQYDTKQYVIIVSQPKAAKKAKAAVEDDEEETPAPKAKGKAKPADDDEDDSPKVKKAPKAKGPAALISEYLDSVVKKDIAKKGNADRMSHKLNIAKWLTNEKELDADAKKETMKVYNDDDQIDAILDTLGLKRNEDDEFVEQD